MTDLADHVPLLQATVHANPAALGTTRELRVQEYVWGGASSLHDTASSSSSFDLVLGSDVAYGEECYDDLLQSLQALLGGGAAAADANNGSSSSSVALIGFTLMDTRPYFFDRMVAEYGLTYRKLSDHLLGSAFRGTTFGVFVIQQQQQQAAAAAPNGTDGDSSHKLVRR